LRVPTPTAHFEEPAMIALLDNDRRSGPRDDDEDWRVLLALAALTLAVLVAVRQLTGRRR
jgi:hypothetical protein